jgi:hypothetical protein
MMPPMTSLHPISDQPRPARTLEHWRNVRWFIEVIWNLFGGPETIAALRNLSRADHKLLASWMHKAESLVRKILLIEAADVRVDARPAKPRQAKPRKAKPRKAAPREKARRTFHAHEPQTWRVSFRISVRRSRASNSRRAYGAGFVCPDAWPLAGRFEALMRVFDCPERYIARAARRLRRQPKLIAALAAPMRFAGLEEIFEPLTPLLFEARDAFARRDSS